MTATRSLATRPLERSTAPAHDPAAEPRRSPGTRPPARAGDDATAWLHVCPLDRLRPGRGAAALVGSVQIALFRLAGDTLHAVGNVDPFTGAAVISRGIVGDRQGVPTVASPVHKQAFSLIDGRCLDDEAVRLPVFQTRVHGADLQIGLR